jgi:hypothetical protein
MERFNKSMTKEAIAGYVAGPNRQLPDCLLIVHHCRLDLNSIPDCLLIMDPCTTAADATLRVTTVRGLATRSLTVCS